jgi:hypothetical protein
VHGEQKAIDLFGGLLEPGAASGSTPARAVSGCWGAGSWQPRQVSSGLRRRSTGNGARRRLICFLSGRYCWRSRFEVFLRWDNAVPDEVEELAELLAGWRQLIGRGVSRGRSRCAVDEVQYGTLNLV